MDPVKTLSRGHNHFLLLGLNEGVGHPAFAIPIGPTVIENFEGYVPGPDIIQHPDLGSFLIPGVGTPFTFKSGLTLISPIPNPGSRLGGFPDVQGVVLGDFSLNGPGPTGAPFCFEIDCVATPDDLPSGTGYLAYNGLASHGDVEFTFPGLVSFAGVYVTGASGITLTAFDKNDKVIETAQIEPVLADQWRDNFVSVEDRRGIERIALSGDFFVMDDFTFVTAVPEPSSGVLLLTVIFLLFGARTLHRRSSINIR